MDQGNGSAKINRKLMELTTQVAAAYVGNNKLAEGQIPDVIRSVYSSLAGLNGHAEVAPKFKQKPAVPINKSITPDYLICLEDGKKFTLLKRHLRTAFGLSPEDYRAKWGLSPDYPMVAPNYAKERSEFAKKIGLGKKSVTPHNE